MKAIRFLIPCTLLLSGCAALPRAYRQADEATFQAIAPEYEAYVEKDERLIPAQKELRHRTVASWRSRLEAGWEAFDD